MRHALALRTAADTSGVVHDVLAKLEEAGTSIALARLAANSAAGFRPFVIMTDSMVRRSALDRRISEIVILHLAARQGADYEWGRHEPAARRHGVTNDQIEVLRSLAQLTEPTFDVAEMIACALADDLLEGIDVRKGWDNVVEQLGKDAAVDLIFTVAFWGGFVPILVRGLVPLSSTEITEEP